MVNHIPIKTKLVTQCYVCLPIWSVLLALSLNRKLGFTIESLLNAKMNNQVVCEKPHNRGIIA